VTKFRILLFAALLVAQVPLDAGVADPFMITIFKNSQRVFPLRGNDLIRSEAGCNLAELDSVKAIKPGSVVLRKKYEPSDYRFYSGSIDTAAFHREPPLYSFTIPSNVKFKEFIRKRFYFQQTSNQNCDIEELYFDACSFYVRHAQRVWYYENDSWRYIDGKRLYPLGSLAISSDPPGAQLIVNGISMLKRTPCQLENIPYGNYAIELFLPHYHFSHKEICLKADTLLPMSFELLSDFDTVYISGNSPYGSLILPQPPIDQPFLIDTMYAEQSKINLFPGVYRVRWDGGDLYRSVDTTIKVTEGRITYFDYVFQRCKGVLKVSPIPFDAEVCIEDVPCSCGERLVELPSGTYRVSVQRQGFKAIKTTARISTDSLTDIKVDLRMNADRDADGYLDTVDKCPDVYGIYDGCPHRRLGDALADKKDDVLKFVKEDRFEVGFSLIGIISRFAAQKQFANFLSVFSSGRLGAVNNYRGLTFGNSFHLMYKGLYGSVEFGQWSAGIHYKRPDTLFLKADDRQYAIFYDSLQDIEPVIYLPSTAVTVGFHYNWSWVNVVYSLGYQWEDIMINKIYNVQDSTFNDVVFNNDWWFHQIHLEADFHADNRFAPSVYFNFKFPFGPSKRTRWHVMQFGLQMKLFPAGVKGKQKNE
jgi:hypothetical protein